MASTAAERYDSARPTYVRVNAKRFADLPAGSTVLIPSPQDIGAEIERMEPGERATLTMLRDRLAERHGADGSCPVMTGMNLRIVADLALDELAGGAGPEEVTPVWRVIAAAGALAHKLPGGPQRIAQLQRDEAST